MINVSHNELITQCTKAFEGLQRQCGEADMIANMVVDLEMVGLNGVSHFVNALHFLALEQDEAVYVEPVINQQLTANLLGCSILCHLPNLLDFTIDNLANRSSIVLNITQCHHRWLAFSELIKLAGKGLSVKAQWLNSSDYKQVVYILNAGQLLPELYIANHKVTANELSLIMDLQSLSIEISKKTLTFPFIKEDYQHLSSFDLQAAKQHAWKHGISIAVEHWQIIKHAASALLVESNEISPLSENE
ncbi:DUF3726 domain-containing protein [Photobacterium phosphoreum]|uniref:DUF3726 domain-containing protein n=1 Tax=Photobacterium phosphoreum TaxID=659 RepID=UPI0006971C0B|nr:DUF3726 domain-containing protein [Photobacterium phosphoreum]MCD9477777.1 DUF3726 domain-containing protein [Photobacterium phosphoreum]MCD9484213.1 DUF3726 domain-containing protein [Photobacterium phosphoreum]MCD9503005.1 DUF3726 domain-containing protein [Photobacterium phosphoreum]MCD9517832.1 DUF3726 domain-containing protein [Photobacterium phosphoreum]PSU40544.1 DUF3726 domain-containing protein [Photobacterium phosphoreum]